MSNSDRWPELPYAAWKDTCATLQLWTQIVGKIRLALMPWLNHSWHVTLRVTARGLATPLISTATHDFQIELDFIDHTLWIRTADGHTRQVMLRPVSVAEFYADVMIALDELGIRVAIDEMPNEIPDAIPVQRGPRARRLRSGLRQPVLARAAARARGVRRASAPRSSARRARCISSGAASTSR